MANDKKMPRSERAMATKTKLVVMACHLTHYPVAPPAAAPPTPAATNCFQSGPLGLTSSHLLPSSPARHKIKRTKKSRTNLITNGSKTVAKWEERFLTHRLWRARPRQYRRPSRRSRTKRGRSTSRHRLPSRTFPSSPSPPASRISSNSRRRRP